VQRRDGAIRWSIWHDTADPGRYVATYVVESWAEHLRQNVLRLAIEFVKIGFVLFTLVNNRRSFPI